MAFMADSTIKISPPFGTTVDDQTVPRQHPSAFRSVRLPKHEIVTFQLPLVEGRGKGMGLLLEKH